MAQTLTFTTTLNEIKRHNPCQDGWEKGLAALGKTEADNDPLHLRNILKASGVANCIWTFRCFPPEYDRTWRLMAADFAEQALHIYEKRYPNDDRPRKAIQAARDYANGLISKEDAIAAARAADAAADAHAASHAALAAVDAAFDAAARASYRAAARAADAALAAYRAAYAFDAAFYAAYSAVIETQADIILKYIN